jgi:hypothetical protein
LPCVDFPDFPGSTILPSRLIYYRGCNAYYIIANAPQCPAHPRDLHANATFYLLRTIFIRAINVSSHFLQTREHFSTLSVPFLSYLFPSLSRPSRALGLAHSLDFSLIIIIIIKINILYAYVRLWQVQEHSLIIDSNVSNERNFAISKSYLVLISFGVSSAFL